MNAAATVYTRAVARLTAGVRGPHIVCAYHGNVDTIHQLTQQSLDRIVAPDEPTVADAPTPGAAVPVTASSPPTPPSGRLASKPDVVTALLWCLRTGNGGEWQLADGVIQTWVEGCFPGTDSLGGTSAIAANHLAGLGYQPVLHAPSQGGRLMALLHPGVRFAESGPSGERGEESVLVSPERHADLQETDPVHVIVQFNRGDRFRVHGVEIVCPHSNRVIFSNDAAASRLPIDPAFQRWIRENSGAIAGGIWCGYNLLDPAVLSDRLAEIESDVAAASAHGAAARPGAAVHHFESSDARDPEVRRVMLGSMLHNRPSVGLNEEEFATLVAMYGIAVGSRNGIASCSDSVSGTDPERVAKALAQLAGRLNSGTLVLHTARWAMGASRLADPEQLAAALAGGCAVADLRAGTAEFATPERLHAVVGAVRPVADVQPGAIRLRDYTVVWVPALDIGSPICTIGLGDSFVAGFVAASVQ